LCFDLVSFLCECFFFSIPLIPFFSLLPHTLPPSAAQNTVKKGVVKFLTADECSFCATYDIGRAAAVQFKNREAWLGKSLDVIGWRGDLAAVAAALEAVSGVKTKAKLAMPKFLRRWLFPDLDAMCLAYEGKAPGPRLPKGSPEDFKKVVPDAMSAEDWFRSHGRYANGDKICAA
jgi:hypothetical protein